MNYNSKSIKVLALTLVAAGMTFAAPLAVAQQKAAAAKPKLCAEIKAVDDDTDGTLDLGEAKAAATKVFKKLDKNSDGKLTAAEYKSRVSKKEFEAGNPDKDKTLELPEWLAMTEARFKAANPDNDATLECDELKSKAGKSFLKFAR